MLSDFDDVLSHPIQILLGNVPPIEINDSESKQIIIKMKKRKRTKRKRTKRKRTKRKRTKKEKNKKEREQKRKSRKERTKKKE